MNTRVSVHPSAEDFLRQLILFIDSHGSALLSSKQAFKLQPRALEYVALRLDGLCRLQRVKTSNPIRFLAGAVADLTDFLRMEKVQQFCSRVRQLKLYSSAQDVRDPTPINFTPFKSVATLEIRGCDLSSVCPKGVEYIQSTVELLIVQDSLECLWHLLEPHRLEDPELTVSPRWTKLTRLSCIYNDLKDLDASLRLVPNVTALDVSRNKIRLAQHLCDLTHLIALDISCNRLRELGEITMCVGLRRLFLQNNAIRKLDGIRQLERLEELDLRWNVISTLSEVAKLKPLSSLKSVSLAGNPIGASANYRLHVLACLLEWRGDVMLDGKSASEVEGRKARRLTVTHDGMVEAMQSDSITTVPTPSSLWAMFSPVFRPFRRRYFEPSSPSEAAMPILSEEDALLRPTPRPIKRIVDLPDATFEETVDVEAVDTRVVPRKDLMRVHGHSRDFSHFYDSYDESRFSTVGLA